MTYDDYSRQLFQGRVDVGVLLTKNAGEGWFEANIQPNLEWWLSRLHRLNGRLEIRTAFDTLQFSRYDNYHAASFNEAHKLAVHREQHPKAFRQPGN